MLNKDELIKSACEKLEQNSEEARYLAVKELAGCDSSAVIPFLLKAAGDSSYRVREEALRSICAYPGEQVFPRLESSLRDHENAGLRNAAIEAFTRYGKNATSFLSKLAKDYDEEVRIFSATIMGEIKDPGTVDILIELLNDPEENVKHAAAESLGKIEDPRAVEPLIGCLSRDFWIQYPAIVALGNIRDPVAIPALAKLVDDEMLCQPVVEALGKIGDISAISILTNILKNNDSSVWNTAIAALVNIQSRIERYFLPDGNCLPSIKKSLDKGELLDYLIRSLEDGDIEVRKNAVIALGWLKEERAAKYLIPLLNDCELDEFAIGSLASIGEAALPDIILGLTNPDPAIKAALIRCLGWMENIEGIRACLPFLQDANAEVRYQSIKAMAPGLNEEDIEDAMLKILPEPNPELHQALIEVLAKSKSKKLASKLQDLLDADNDSAIIGAMELLPWIREKSIYPRLRKLLCSANDRIRSQAYNALLAIDHSTIDQEILSIGLSDKSPAVRKIAAEYLAFGDKEQVEKSIGSLLKDPDPEVRLAAITTLGKCQSATRARELIQAFQSEDRKTRLAIVRAMGNIRDRECTCFLEDLLRKVDADLKKTVIEALGQIKDPMTVPALIVALDDPDWGVRIAAVRALGNIKDPRCESHLLRKLEDKEDIVKKEIIAVLGQFGSRNNVNSLIPLLVNENLQLEILATLEKLGIPDIDYYFEFFKRVNTRMKCILIDLLGRIRAAAAERHLEELLTDGFFTVRAHAAKALGDIGNRKAVPILLRSLKEDPSEEVQKEAALALQRLDTGR